MDSGQTANSIFEELLRKAVIENYTNEIDSIPSNEELANQYSLSSEFELRMKKLFAQDKRKHRLNKTFEFAQRAAIITIMLLLIPFIVLLTNAEVRATVNRVVREWFSTHVTFTFDRTPHESTRQELQFGYMPEGFFANSTSHFDDTIIIWFKNETEEKIRITQHQGIKHVQLAVDNENKIIENHILFGNEAFVATAICTDFDNTVIFVVDDHTIKIWSRIHVDILLKIAESVYFR